MLKEKSKEGKKCTVVHIPIHLLEKIESFREKNGKSKNTVLIEILEKGLENYN